MAVQSDLASNVPVLLGQRTLQVAPSSENKIISEASEPLQKGSLCERWFPIKQWFQMLYATFGSFIPLAMLSYGLQQSFARQSTEFACKYYMMDELKLDGVTMGRYLAASHLPWNLKPVWGMLSDAVPLWGFHRTSYLVALCSLSVLLYLWIGFQAVSALGLVAFMTFSNWTVAFSDLIIDATAAGLAKCHPGQACDLQTSLRAAEATGGILSSAVKGAMVSNLSPRGTILTNAFWAVAVLVPGLRGWLPEERLPRGSRCTPNVKGLSQNSSLTFAAIFLASLAVTLSVTQTFLPNWQSRAIVLTLNAIAVTFSAYKAFSRISPYLWKTAMLLFLRACFSPGLGESMFVWMSKDPNGPLFTPELLGLADCFGQAGLLFGVIFFNKVLRKWKYRSIFLLGQLLVVLLQMMDLILVLRWNRAIGLPDILFLIGDETFDQAVEKTFYVPLVVLAYKVCPSNLEATIFATLIATSNIGVDCGKYMGVALAEVWGIVDGNFDYLPHGIICKALIRLVPIPLMLIFSPDFTPDDPIPAFDEDSAEHVKESTDQKRKSSCQGESN